jgi:hypothetical protein
MYPENSKSIRLIWTQQKKLSYLLLDLALDHRLRYRTHIFSDEHPIDFYVPPIGGKSYKTIQLQHSTRAQDSVSEAKGIISNCDKRLLDDISECILNVLNGNIKLSDCTKRKLKKYKTSLRTLVDKRTPLSAKKRVIIQKGGFLLPLLTTVLTTLASLIFRKSSADSS